MRLMPVAAGITYSGLRRHPRDKKGTMLPATFFVLMFLSVLPDSLIRDLGGRSLLSLHSYGPAWNKNLWVPDQVWDDRRRFLIRKCLSACCPIFSSLIPPPLRTHWMPHITAYRSIQANEKYTHPARSSLVKAGLCGTLQ